MIFDYTVAQAAQILKLSPQRVRVLLVKGRLLGYQAVSPGGRVVWRIHLSLRRTPGKPGRPRAKRASKNVFLVNHKRSEVA